MLRHMAIPFQEKIDRVSKLLGTNDAQIALARNRYTANRQRSAAAVTARADAQSKADRLRAAGHPKQARHWDREAGRQRVVAIKNHERALHFRGRIKELLQEKHGLEVRQEKLQDAAHKYLKNHGVQIHGNKATGGTPEQRWIAVCLASVANCSAGKRRNFYSMPGNWDVDHVIVPGEAPGERSDCSSTVTGWAKAAGLPDPNGADWTGGFTGTLLGAHGGWKEVSRERMVKHGWGYIVYGSGVGHHTEAYIGPGDRTAGHGSAPVDFGVIDLFGSGEIQRYFIYDPD